VTKIISYEGGLIVLATWGMQFLSHNDDCSRAVFAALNIKKHLTQYQLDCSFDSENSADPPVHIGIATGNIFQVVIGDYARREVIGIGPAVERAMLLMECAQVHYGKIYVDALTKQEACHEINFSYVEHLEISSKVLNEAIYQPQSTEGLEDSVIAEYDDLNMEL